MATKNESSKEANQGESGILLIKTIIEAFAELMRASTGTIVALGILFILAAVILQATPEVQENALHLLIGLLGVIIGRMLPQVSISSRPSETPTTQG
jgi:uncharacterized membrane protein HdeD (DUF308 family)